MLTRQSTVYRRMRTDKDPETVFGAIEHALRVTVGGSIMRNGNTIVVQQGNNNQNFSFVADTHAEIVLTQPEEGVVDIAGTIKIDPNALFWIAAFSVFALLLRGLPTCFISLSMLEKNTKPHCNELIWGEQSNNPYGT